MALIMYRNIMFCRCQAGGCWPSQGTSSARSLTTHSLLTTLRSMGKSTNSVQDKCTVSVVSLSVSLSLSPIKILHGVGMWREGTLGRQVWRQRTSLAEPGTLAKPRRVRRRQVSLPPPPLSWSIFDVRDVGRWRALHVPHNVADGHRNDGEVWRPARSDCQRHSARQVSPALPTSPPSSLIPSLFLPPSLPSSLRAPSQCHATCSDGAAADIELKWFDKTATRIA